MDVRRVIDSCPRHAYTVAGFDSLASKRHAAVCRRLWIRRPRATVEQDTERMTAETCSR